MNRITILVGIFLLISTSAKAHTGGKVKLTCPLDNTTFEAWQDFSGTSFGARLDLKKIGPIASPWALAQCPKCGLPLYKDKKDFSADELKKLKQIVEGKRFKDESKGKTAYFALAIIQEELKEEPMDIGYNYLQASWEVEEKNPKEYKEITRRAIKWFDLAAKKAKGQNEELDIYHFAQFLPIELERKNANFDEAKRRLDSFDDVKEPNIEWLINALAYERLLISKKDSDNHLLGDWEELEDWKK